MSTASTSKHATLSFERLCAAPVERVFAAVADPVARTKWGTPTETAAFFYEQTDFRVGGQDLFYCGSKSAPQYRGLTRYYDIVPNERIVSSEVIETGGRRVMISMQTMGFASRANGTLVTLTVQVTSLAGEDMLRGAEIGHKAALDNLVEMMR